MRAVPRRTPRNNTMQPTARFPSLLALTALLAGAIFSMTAWGRDAVQPDRAASPKSAASIWPQGDFSLRGLDGEMHSLSNWKGKVIMLNFWATWCAPCQAEIADFVSFQDEFQAAGLQIIGVGMDEERKLRNVQRTLEINYPILVADPVRNARLMTQWGNDSGIVPYTVVIDRDGQIKYIHRGPLHRDAFDENILPLLGKDKNSL